MEVSNFHLRKITHENWEKSSMIGKTYLEPPYDSFGKDLQISVCIDSNTSGDMDSTGFGTLCLDYDRAHRLQVKLDRHPELSIQLCRVFDSGWR
jgi:hypothetical protein